MNVQVSRFSSNRSPAARIREKFFYSWPATLLTLLIGAVIVFVLGSLFRWAVLQATWVPDPEVCRQSTGACWGFVAEKWRLIVFGRYPYDIQWRPALATALVVVQLFVSAVPWMWHRSRRLWLVLSWALVLFAFFVLMQGGLFGLTKVAPDMWGGLPLTVVLTLIGMTLSIPLGIALAIARRSKMPALSALATGYIELVRGVPLITVLFVAAFIFPLLLPSGARVDSFWRIAVALTLFQAAYMAETVRGGIQTINRAQFEAAASLGLTKFQTYNEVILPQALVAVIPAFVNSLLSCFMDTSLVTVVSMYDLTGSLRLALGDALWRNYFIEGYAFIVLIYFSFSFVISRYSFWLEKRLLGNKTN